MSQILTNETALYHNAWNMGGYGDFSPGEKYLPIFLDAITGGDPGMRFAGSWLNVLDAGAGSGKGTQALLDKGFKVAMCDLSFEGLEDPQLRYSIPAVEVSLWHDLSFFPYVAKVCDPAFEPGFQWGYCCDVMEHIPPQFTMLVVQQILNIVQGGVFFSISLVHDQFGFFAGEPLHKTVEPFTWWRDSLGELGKVTDARDLGNVGTYLVMKP
jgi:2-polyprenyl-3-methyl-5-hydroxy-6-metoxy-1,4-benzoquinol methylase